jgi:hypothetical protein
MRLTSSFVCSFFRLFSPLIAGTSFATSVSWPP